MRFVWCHTLSNIADHLTNIKHRECISKRDLASFCGPIDSDSLVDGRRRQVPVVWGDKSMGAATHGLGQCILACWFWAWVGYHRRQVPVVWCGVISV